MADRYLTFEELAANHRSGQDYEIEYVIKSPTVVVLAPHGGRIEPYTTEIARGIAGERFSFYSFLGRMPKGSNQILHITSHRFDEPVALEAQARAWISLSVHGHRDRNLAAVMIGGLDEELIAVVEEVLSAEGFAIEECGSRIAGREERNVVNRNRRGRGVQLELTCALRRELASSPVARARFQAAVHHSLSQHAERFIFLSDSGQAHE